MYIILTIVILFLFSDREEPIEPTSVFTEITKAEETFYHPITGYKGTSTEIETYIKNRERKLNK